MQAMNKRPASPAPSYQSPAEIAPSAGDTHTKSQDRSIHLALQLLIKLHQIFFRDR